MPLYGEMSNFYFQLGSILLNVGSSLVIQNIKTIQTFYGVVRKFESYTNLF